MIFLEDPLIGTDELMRVLVIQFGDDEQSTITRARQVMHNLRIVSDELRCLLLPYQERLAETDEHKQIVGFEKKFVNHITGEETVEKRYRYIDYIYLLMLVQDDFAKNGTPEDIARLTRTANQLYNTYYSINLDAEKLAKLYPTVPLNLCSRIVNAFKQSEIDLKMLCLFLPIDKNEETKSS